MTYPDDLRAEVDRYLESLEFSQSPETRGLQEAMKYSLLAGGKRVRPVLCLATGRSLGQASADLLPAAAAIEMVHCYSLVHDDLPAMDDDDLRRGIPTAHVEFGEAVAILSGDALFAEAVALLASGPWPAEQVLEAVGTLTAAAGVEGMVGGQFLDVTYENLDAPALERLHGLKTGALIRASVEMALAVSGIEDSDRSAYREFATEVGILFQIVDDILDVVGSTEETGKPQGTDERHGKITYATLHGLDRARQLASETHARAINALRRVEGDTRSLRDVADYIHDRDR